MAGLNKGVLSIPPELTEHALTLCHPRDVAAFSRTCRKAHTLVYSSPDQYLWRQLFLLYPFDDARNSLHPQFYEESRFNWAAELQKRVRAETVARSKHPRDDALMMVLETFVSVVQSASPVTGEERVQSPSLLWVVAVLQASNILRSSFLIREAERGNQVLSRLRSYLALTLDDYDDEEEGRLMAQRLRARSRCQVYDLRNYRQSNAWGPFTEIGHINWIHIESIINVILGNLAETLEWSDIRPPCGLEATRAFSAPGTTGRSSADWAGVEGTWRRFICFMDYRDLHAFNFRHRAHPSFFEDSDFQEATRLIELKLHLIETANIPRSYTLDRFPDSCNPKYPTLYFAGTSWGIAHGNESIVVGSVSMSDEGIVRWRFASVFENRMQWSSEGAQIGDVASAAGIVGTWTGAHHEHQDPVGPFWLWRVADNHPSFNGTI
ncbi:hypothetical protein BJ138DRAFT_1064635 [Hygrophoropsis aurantiaca]|uniref:Uncharacterized protein n=1 Tax=Hygrophoropsis aurantiaca TaxID=72124 RepID=A0ACB8ADF5_9AGAM|nr:hypothetical protein BJ138DRAFT_1064635 [Hygrophoropsis aurantiaca]